MFRILATLMLLACGLNSCWAQVDFSGTFQYLNVPVNSFLAGSGGVNVSLNDQDVGFVTSNPGLVGEELDKNISLNYILFPGQIKISNATYLTKISNTGTWAANVLYFNYGKIEGYDPTGSSIGPFHASEYAFTISKSHRIGNYRLGANLRFANSGIAGYSASALIFDLGGVFIHPDKDITAGLVIKNAGVVISDYTDTGKSHIPFDVQVGTTFKPAHMPVRFSFTMYELTKWKTEDKLLEEAGIEIPSAVDKIFRHSIVGAEFLIGKNVELLFGYNHKKRKELKIETAGGGGFSYGLLVGLDSFKFGFSRFGYHKGGVSNTFSVSSNLGKWIKKRVLVE